MSHSSTCTTTIRELQQFWGYFRVLRAILESSAIDLAGDFVQSAALSTRVIKTGEWAPAARPSSGTPSSPPPRCARVYRAWVPASLRRPLPPKPPRVSTSFLKVPRAPTPRCPPLSFRDALAPICVRPLHVEPHIAPLCALVPRAAVVPDVPALALLDLPWELLGGLKDVNAPHADARPRARGRFTRYVCLPFTLLLFFLPTSASSPCTHTLPLQTNSSSLLAPRPPTPQRLRFASIPAARAFLAFGGAFLARAPAVGP
ncbi:hypothetical protein FB451DRAFT_1408666 [Mycena latifolia]|nr:hypothetical protein FB451DRAFT_1408666 [Mycena latifolia]